MSLHDRIMALPIDKNAHPVEMIGFRVARKEAAILAKEADELIRRMGNVIAAIEPTDLPDELNGRVRSALNSYNNWKETTE